MLVDSRGTREARVAGLPRPDLPPGPGRDLVDALHALHHEAGWPSLRVLANEAGCSHTTVYKVFSSPRLPSWGVLELLVEAMGGDQRQFHLLWLAASSPERASTPAAPRIAGRKYELRAVRRHLDSGSGLLLVTGEAGIGKTRLVTTAANLASPRTFVAIGNGLPLSTQVPLLAIADVLRCVHAVEDGRWLKEALGECAAFVPGSLRRLLPELEPTGLLEPDDEWSRQRVFAAVESTLNALTRRRPLAVLIEDLHWADTATLDLVEHLVAHPRDFPMVGTFRRDDGTTPTNTADWFARIQRANAVNSLELAPLTRDETAEQLALLRPSLPAPELVDRIHRRSAGQPLFTEQLAAQHDRDRSLPRLLADLLDSRLERLPPSAWAVVAALGVADRRLTTVILCEVTTLTSPALTAALHDLDQRKLLAGSGNGYDVQLRHPLLAEAVRRRLVPGEAADLHRRLALALASCADPSPAEVAAHWQASDDPGQELAWRIRAAREAHRRFAAAQEAEQWLRVLELWPSHDKAADLPMSKIDAYLATMDALTISGRIEQAKELLDNAMVKADALPSLSAAELHRRASHYSAVLEDRGVALQHAKRAVEIYETAGPCVGLVQALEQVARTLQLMGRLDEASTYVVRAVEASAAAGDVGLQRRMLAQQVWHTGMAGDLDGAVALAQAAWSLELPAPDPEGDVYLGAVHTDVLLHAGASADEIESAAIRSLAAADDWSLDTTALAALRSNIARALIAQGKIDRAAQFIDPLTETPVTRNRRAIHAERAALDVVRGQLEAAASRVRVLDGMLDPTLGNQLEFEDVAACSELWAGHPEAALGRLLRLLDEVATTLVSEFAGYCMALAARAAADAAETTPQQREALLTRLVNLHARMAIDPFGVTIVPAARTACGAQWTAELARLADTQTAERWVAAAGEWEKLAHPHDSAYCRWRGAQVARATGQATLATKLLRRAARDAREHAPLSAAIEESAGQR